MTQLEAAETRIADLETCECRKPCVQFDANNKTVMKVDGSVWQHGCETCTCLVSVVINVKTVDFVFVLQTITIGMPCAKI